MGLWGNSDPMIEAGAASTCKKVAALERCARHTRCSHVRTTDAPAQGRGDAKQRPRCVIGGYRGELDNAANNTRIIKAGTPRRITRPQRCYGCSTGRSVPPTVQETGHEYRAPTFRARKPPLRAPRPLRTCAGPGGRGRCLRASCRAFWWRARR